LAEILLSREAVRQLERLPKMYAAAVDGAISTLEDHPLVGKPLRGRLRGLRSLRVGVYRVLYELAGRRKAVLIVSVRHPGEAYRDAR